MSEEYTNALPSGTRLDTYQIERVLGVGGFGVTYLARDLNLGKTYAIKELLPDGIAVRQAGEATVKAKSSGNCLSVTRCIKRSLILQLLKLLTQSNINILNMLRY